MVEQELPKLQMRVRFPLPALVFYKKNIQLFNFQCIKNKSMDDIFIHMNI